LSWWKQQEEVEWLKIAIWCVVCKNIFFFPFFVWRIRGFKNSCYCSSRCFL